MTFKPSPEQQAIFDYVLQQRHLPGRKALAIEALAGTGKTTTLVELVKLAGNVSGVYVALNRSIVQEVEPKFKGTGITPKTFHSLGNGSLRKVIPGNQKPDGLKYHKLAETWYAQHDRVQELVAAHAAVIEDDDERFKFRKQLEKATVSLLKDLCDWLRMKLIDWDDLEALAHLINHNNLAEDVPYDDILDVVLNAVPGVMATAETHLKQRGELDFTDMIYWCVKWKLNLPKYYFVLGDEIQDMSPMQRAMIQMSLADNSFLIAVGDRNQAIYNFAGADSDSFDLTVKAFNCHVLPLTVTRRCGRVITYHAQTLVAEFTALDTAPRGKIVWLEDKLLSKYAEKGDLIVCRVKAPLMGACLDLLAAGKAATIIDSDIGKALMKVLDKIQNRKGFKWEDFELHLSAYTAAERAKCLKKNDEAGADAISDQCEALRVVYERTQPASAEQLLEEIDNLFKDEAKNTIKLCTAHKSKGLEAERVFLLRPEKFPLSYPTMTEEQRVQEGNLEYVAITRAKATLVYLVDKDYRQKHLRPAYVQDGTFEELDWDGESLIRVKEVEVEAETPEPVVNIPALPAPEAPASEVAAPEIAAPEAATPVGEPDAAPADVSPIGEKEAEPLTVLPPKAAVLPPNPFARSLLTEMRTNGKQLTEALDDDETQSPDDEVTQAAEPVPFKVTGNLKADFAAAKQNANDRIFASLTRLTLEQALTLRDLLDTVIDDLQASA